MIPLLPVWTEQGAHDSCSSGGIVIPVRGGRSIHFRSILCELLCAELPAGAWLTGIRSTCHLFLLLCGLLTVLSPAQASPVSSPSPYVLNDQPSAPLGAVGSYWQEEAGPATLEAVRQVWQRGGFRAGVRAVEGFGIAPRPVWMRLEVQNPAASAQSYRLMVGSTWIDRLDVFLVREGEPVQSWQAGDDQPGVASVHPAQGFGFALALASGSSEIYIRAETVDPLILQVWLQPQAALEGIDLRIHYGYGLLYGFLLALTAYNALLYGGLRSRSYLYYALYLISFIVGSLSYTGHGFAWWWPQAFVFQRYVILVAMVLMGCTGFLFAVRFLELGRYAPRVKHFVVLLSGLALLLQGIFVAGDLHLAAALLAFSFMSLFAGLMVWLGVLALRHRVRAGSYFLLAAVCGMLGVLSTTLSVWGWLPLNRLTFHGVEAGVLLEATLLALALADRVRTQERARELAERLARIDILTELPNRRAFIDAAAGLWSTAQRNRRPLSVIMLDIDNFKAINDEFGHDAGDSVLVSVAKILARNCHNGDVVSRWGGEEFIMLLPETDLAQACVFAERIRHEIEQARVTLRTQAVHLTISLGAAERDQHASLDALIREADQWLYHAKRQGRNQVASCRCCTQVSA